MAELSERHEVRLRGKNQTIVFIADSDDGRLVIRQEPDGKKIEDVCSITLADPDELRAFFKGLRRIIASLGYDDQVDQQRAQHSETSQPRERTLPPAASDDREAVVAQARQKNPQAFAAWTKERNDRSVSGTTPVRAFSQ